MRYFKVIYKRGKKIDSTIIEALNKAIAIENFFNKKIGVLVKIYEVKKPLSIYLREIKTNFLLSIKNRQLKLEKLISIIDQIAIMIDAGLPLNTALNEIVKAEKKDKIARNVFENIARDIEGGMSFYDAAKKYRKQLGYLTLAMIHVGEETGTLPQSLERLSEILQAILESRRKFKKATRYPIFVIVAMIIAIGVVTVKVLPEFENIFKESKMELPLPTKILLGLEHFVLDYGLLVLSAAVIGISIIISLYKKDKNVKLFIDKIILKIYIIGKVTFYSMISRFLYVFRVLVQSGIPMNEAVNTANGIVENSYIHQKLSMIPYAIEEGKSLYMGFKETELFESMAIEMLKAGETGGALDRMLEKIGKIYQDKFDYIVDNISSLIEPILIGVIAVFVLMLALGVFLPMWNMVNLAK